MAHDPMMSERYLVVARLTQRQLETFPAKGWVVVEVFNDEASGRDRLQKLRVVLERLKLGAVLIRAMTTADFERIAYEKTVISKDADFWDLQHAELTRASQLQQQAWHAAIAAVLAELAAEREAAARAALAAKASREQTKARAGVHQRHVTMAAGFVGVVAVVGTIALLRSGDAPSARTSARADSMTVIIADPTDPRMLTEYALKPDGTRSVVRRLTREQVAAGAAQSEPEPTAATPSAPRQPKASLAEAMNGFFSVRE